MQASQLLVMVSDASLQETLVASDLKIHTVNCLEEIKESTQDSFIACLIECAERDMIPDFKSFQLKIPWIVISESCDVPFILKLFSSGAFAFMTKPINFNKLKKFLQVAVELQNQKESLEIISATPSWIEVNIPSHIGYITILCSFLEYLIVDLTERENERILFAFRELVQNAIEHGSQGCLEKRVNIRYLRSKYFMIFQIQDQGHGFDLKSLPHAAIGSRKNAAMEVMRYRKQSGMRPGGLGISYVLGIADEIIYNQKGNGVTIVKYVHKEKKFQYE